MKPITPERRAEFEKLGADGSYPHPNAWANAVEELLDAEEYWRMAVADRDPLGDGDYNGNSDSQLSHDCRS